MRSFISFLKDESGAAAAEYALILAVVAGGIAVAAGTLRHRYYKHPQRDCERRYSRGLNEEWRSG